MRSHEPAIRLVEHPDASALRRAWGRVAMAAVCLLALTGIFACWCDTPMIWDGAYQFCFTLIRQRPYFYLTRFHSYVLWLPMAWLSRFTDNLALLKLAYGLPFTLAPALSVLMSWGVVKDRAPQLILWAIFGAAAGPLPGQIFIINDSIFQQHMFWPVFLGVLVSPAWQTTVMLALLAVFQFSHQIGLLLLAGAAGAALLLAGRDSRNRFRLAATALILAGLAVVALWKIRHFPDSYAQREFTWDRIRESWRYGVEGYPLRGVALMWLAGACVTLHQMLDSSRRRSYLPAVRVLAGVSVLAAAVLWTVWAADAHKWSTAANYRRWVVPLTAPFYLLAFLDRWRSLKAARREPEESSPQPHRPAPPPRPPLLPPSSVPRLIGVAVAITFMVVLSIQSIVWARATRRLMADVESYPRAIVPWDRIAWTRDTALYHWGTTSYVFVLEGRKPRKLLLDANREAAASQTRMLFDTPPTIPLAPFTPIPPTPGPAGWFDFRPLLFAAHHEPQR